MVWLENEYIENLAESYIICGTPLPSCFSNLPLLNDRDKQNLVLSNYSLFVGRPIGG